MVKSFDHHLPVWPTFTRLTIVCPSDQCLPLWPLFVFRWASMQLSFLMLSRGKAHSLHVGVRTNQRHLNYVFFSGDRFKRKPSGTPERWNDLYPLCPWLSSWWWSVEPPILLKPEDPKWRTFDGIKIRLQHRRSLAVRKQVSLAAGLFVEVIVKNLLQKNVVFLKEDSNALLLYIWRHFRCSVLSFIFVCL